jgi:hypothetical protein
MLLQSNNGGSADRMQCYMIAAALLHCSGSCSVIPTLTVTAGTGVSLINQIDATTGL